MGEFIDYDRMTPEQQAQVREHLLTKSMTVEHLSRWRFYVRNDGVVTRQKGCHQATDAYRKHMDAEFLAVLSKAPMPSKDQPVPVKSGVTFTTSRG